MLPGQNGVEVTRKSDSGPRKPRVQAQEETANSPSIIATGIAQPGVQNHGGRVAPALLEAVAPALCVLIVGAVAARVPPRLREQAAGSGKPENIVEKMVEGRIRKYYEEVVLLEQVWVHDGESRVKAVAQKAGVKLAGFARFQLGEGIDKPQGPDFASEVAATAGGPKGSSGGAETRPGG